MHVSPVKFRGPVAPQAEPPAPQAIPPGATQFGAIFPGVLDGFWAVFGCIFKSGRARFSYFQKFNKERSNMLRPDMSCLRIDHCGRIVRRALETAAFASNTDCQRPTDRSRGVPRHLSAPPRRTASPRCASGCVSGRRVGFVQHPAAQAQRHAQRAQRGVFGAGAAGVLEAAGDLPPELPVWRPRAGRPGVLVAGALPRRRRLAAAATPVRMSGAGPAAALALKTQSRLSAADNDFAATAAAGQALCDRSSHRATPGSNHTIHP